MNLRLARDLASRCLALTGVLALLTTSRFQDLLSIIAILAVCLSFLQVLSRKGTWLSKKTWNVLNVFVVLFFIADVMVISQSMLASCTRLTLFLLLNKLFNLRTSEDHFQLYLISFLQLLAASTFTSDITFGVVFILYLLAALWALLLHHLVVQAEAQGSPSTLYGLRFPFFLATNLMALATLGGALLLFFMVPRVGLGYFNEWRSDRIGVSGFSEEVKLGEVGEVKLDPTVVMRAKVSWDGDQTKVPSFYWRGMVFDNYDGHSWKNSHGKGRRIVKKFENGFTVAPPFPNRPMLVQEIMLEPLETSVLFAATQPIRIKGQFSALQVNTAQAIRLNYTPSGRFSYTAYSQIPVFDEADARVDSLHLPDRISNYYLQLPLKSDRIITLAEEVTQPARSMLQRVLLIEKFLKENYTYSLDIDPSSGKNPIEDFLFEQKEGYCEQYATAMILLLRGVEIPARMVSGFLRGDWNEYGDYFTVRNSDAHTWVEVWFPNSGWIPFDPTPSADELGSIPILATVLRLIDSLHWTWNRYVVHYSLRDQVDAVKEVRARSSRLRETVFTGLNAMWSGILKALPNWRLWDSRNLMAGIIVALLAIGIYFVGKPLFRRILGRWGWIPPDSSSSTVDFYERLLALLARQGLNKPPSSTPMEFCQKVELAWMKSCVTDLTTLYYRVRFGSRELTAEELSHVEDSLRYLKNPPPQHASP